VQVGPERSLRRMRPVVRIHWCPRSGRKPHRIRFPPRVSPVCRPVPAAGSPLTLSPVCFSQLDLKTGESIQDPGTLPFHDPLLEPGVGSRVCRAGSGRAPYRRAAPRGCIDVAPGYRLTVSRCAARNGARRGGVERVLTRLGDPARGPRGICAQRLRCFGELGVVGGGARAHESVVRYRAARACTRSLGARQSGLGRGQVSLVGAVLGGN
jgi:hypothetical protein